MILPTHAMNETMATISGTLVATVPIRRKNTSAATRFPVVARGSTSPQRADELGHQRKGIVKGLNVGDLRADMHVDAGNMDARQAGGLPGRPGPAFASVYQDIRVGN